MLLVENIVEMMEPREQKELESCTDHLVENSSIGSLNIQMKMRTDELAEVDYIGQLEENSYLPKQELGNIHFQRNNPIA